VRARPVRKGESAHCVSRERKPILDAKTQIYAALKLFRGRGAIDLAVLEELLVRFSQLMIE
jgi:hypothetical protein